MPQRSPPPSAATRSRLPLAHWSVNPKVVIFWFNPTDDPKGLDVTHLAAFDAQGKQLPAGNSGIGHG